MDIDIILNEFTSPQQAVDLGLMAEKYGVRGIWSSNYGWSRDPFIALSLLADRSSRIRLGPMAISAEELHPLNAPILPISSLVKSVWMASRMLIQSSCPVACGNG